MVLFVMVLKGSIVLEKTLVLLCDGSPVSVMEKGFSHIFIDIGASDEEFISNGAFASAAMSLVLALDGVNTSVLETVFQEGSLLKDVYLYPLLLLVNSDGVGDTSLCWAVLPPFYEAGREIVFDAHLLFDVVPQRIMHSWCPWGLDGCKPQDASQVFELCPENILLKGFLKQRVVVRHHVFVNMPHRDSADSAFWMVALSTFGFYYGILDSVLGILFGMVNEIKHRENGHPFLQFGGSFDKNRAGWESLSNVKTVDALGVVGSSDGAYTTWLKLEQSLKTKASDFMTQFESNDLLWTAADVMASCHAQSSWRLISY